MNANGKLTELTDEASDAYRVGEVMKWIKRPLKIVEGKRCGQTAWAIADAEGKEIKFKGRGVLATIVKAINEMQI